MWIGSQLARSYFRVASLAYPRRRCWHVLSHVSWRDCSPASVNITAAWHRCHTPSPSSLLPHFSPRHNSSRFSIITERLLRDASVVLLFLLLFSQIISGVIRKLHAYGNRCALRDCKERRGCRVKNKWEEFRLTRINRFRRVQCCMVSCICCYDCIIMQYFGGNGIFFFLEENSITNVMLCTKMLGQNYRQMNIFNIYCLFFSFLCNSRVYSFYVER